MTRKLLQWLGRTPVQTFVLCPLAVDRFRACGGIGGASPIVPWGGLLLVLGLCATYRLVGRYRLGLAGGGPRRWRRRRIGSSPKCHMCATRCALGHLIFMLGLALTFWSSIRPDPAGPAQPGSRRARIARRARLQQTIFGADYAATISNAG